MLLTNDDQMTSKSSNRKMSEEDNGVVPVGHTDLESDGDIASEINTEGEEVPLKRCGFGSYRRLLPG